ncbi:DUF3597 domain-containing protein [Pseudomonas sp. HR96]|uniref:DUF3597 domain-containing protein n=1 Tax=Pseudomonas sp. HR96 TaxID=1027966 RepID=UPI002A74F1AA|nr:DUF3597 domain-containing protein [Pseudomonas sp. HR96]WPO98195.1 DUF3597 domain-containing protein [Pseudomonas sp. HR96]
MSLFSAILEKLGIGPHTDASAQPAPAPTTPTADAPSAGAPASSATQAVSSVDVAAKLDGLASNNPEKLNWRTSIVDLLKLLGLDSGLTKRQELAKELKYSGSTEDSASMNIWLHKEVLRKIAENGGELPADLH